MAVAAFVQGKIVQAGNSGITSVAATFDTAVPVGQLIWVGVSWIKSTTVASITASVAGGTGNTYTANTERIRGGSSANLAKIQSFYVLNQQNAAHTITATLSGGTVDRAVIAIASASGVAATSPFEEQHWAYGSGVSSLNVGTSVTDEDNAIIFTMVSTLSDRTFTVPTAFTATATDVARGAAAYQQASAPGSYETVWNWTGGTAHGQGLVDVFRADPPAAPVFSSYQRVRSRGLNHRLN